MPFQSEKQRRYLWANEPEIARDWTDTYGSRIKKNKGGITQADAVNYNPSKMVSVPKEFRARAHSPNTHLAYITDDEAGILQALKPDTPHKGPRGIPNYDSFDADQKYTSGAAMSAAETGSRNTRDIKEMQAQFNTGNLGPGVTPKEAEDIRASFIAAGGGPKASDTDEIKKKAKQLEKKADKRRRKSKREDRKAIYSKRQIDYLQKQKLNALISRLNRRGYTDFKKGETTFEDIQQWLGTLSPGHPAMQPGGDASLVERWQDFTDKHGNPLYDKETIEKWEKSGYVPNYPGTTGIGSLDMIGDVMGTPGLAKNQIQDYLDTYTKIGESGDMNWLDRMKEFEPHRYAQHQGDLIWNPIQGKFEPKPGGGDGGPGQNFNQNPVPPTIPPEDPEDPADPADPADPQVAGLPFKDYYVGDAPTAANLAWGQQFGVDPRTMGLTSWAADGGRIGRAYGGIMDSSTGRRAYGFGSFFKKIGRAAKKIIKSPIGKAALLGGLGMYGMGWGPWASTGMWGQAKGAGFLSNMMSNNLKNKLFMKNLGTLADPKYTGEGAGLSLGKAAVWGAPLLAFTGLGDAPDDDDEGFDYDDLKQQYKNEIMRIKRGVHEGTLHPHDWSYLPKNYTYTGAEGGRIGLEGGGDPILREEYEKYVFELKEITPWAIPMTFEQFKEQVRAGQAEGGRTGHYKGGQSIPSDFTLEDATISTTQDKLGGITDVMKQADLFRSGDVGQFYAAQGGRSGYGGGGKAGRPPINLIKGNDQPAAQAPAPMSPNQNKPMNQPMNPMMARGNPMMNRPMMNPMMNRPMMNPMMARGNPMGGRRMAQEGGLMDLGGMEKDYRNEGGFVPIGGQERADDVPARLSKNEFVFTADAVRAAGGGDIDKGAEIMENVMENLEQGGNISEESQGLEGARDMFATSQRLEGVI